MRSETPDLTADLRRGRRAIEGIAGCEIREDFRWLADCEFWALALRLAPPGMVPTEFVPASTDWFVLVSQAYPEGVVGLWPAKDRGLTHTFQHQALNSFGTAGLPMRKGKICTETQIKSLGRHEYDEEPRAPAARMRWHVLRALAWLRAAADGELVRFGEPFELPAYPYEAARVIGFMEDETSFERWENITAQHGVVELGRHPDNDRILVVRKFSTWQGHDLLQPAWGARIRSSDDRQIGVWMRWKELPMLPPWQPPVTGKELIQAAQRVGVDLASILSHLPDGLRDGKRHVLLIGAPIALQAGSPPERQHWLAVELPAFSRLGQKCPGFRAGKHACHEIDRRKLHQIDRIPWIRTENWSEAEISTRGRFQKALREKEILLIGAGALGSAVAELLVRGGAYKLTVLDGDDLEPGNLVRHSLTMKDVGRRKAESLADWLNEISPHASVRAIPRNFPPDAEAVESAEIVLDCTADDNVLVELARFPWAGERHFLSASLGFQAERLFLFQARGRSFPHAEMVGLLQPWLLEERERYGHEELPWAGIGCWHPVLPARVDDVRLFANIVVKRLECIAVNPAFSAALGVFERSEGECLLRQLGERRNA